MNNITLDLKEQKILWAVLNQAQNIGLREFGRLAEQYATSGFKEDIGLPNSMINDWLKQTVEEYDIINTLKAKLCGDLE